MHLLLTDRLTCPGCGPQSGLILLAEEVRSRRIIHGRFGCPSCRETYPVEDGFGDLRPPPRPPLGAEDPRGDSRPASPEESLRMAALLGITEGPGTILLWGPAASHAAALSELVGQVEVVAVDPGLKCTPEREGVSRMVSGPGIPFFSGSLRGVILSGEVSELTLEESARVLAPRGRVAVLQGPPGARSRLESLGLKTILEEGGVLLVERTASATQPLVTLRGL